MTQSLFWKELEELKQWDGFGYVYHQEAVQSTLKKSVEEFDKQIAEVWTTASCDCEEKDGLCPNCVLLASVLEVREQIFGGVK